MASLEWLQDRGFQYVGEWVAAGSIVHRLAWLRRQPGVYAFVVGGEVHYIGKTVKLHSRLRNYSRRSFGPELKPRRAVHKGIRETVDAGAKVSVYVLPAAADDVLTIEQHEKRLIKEALPAWNAPS